MEQSDAGIGESSSNFGRVRYIHLRTKYEFISCLPAMIKYRSRSRTTVNSKPEWLSGR